MSYHTYILEQSDRARDVQLPNAMASIGLREPQGGTYLALVPRETGEYTIHFNRDKPISDLHKIRTFIPLTPEQIVALNELGYRVFSQV